MTQNLLHRHLTFDKRVALAAKLMPKLGEAGRARQRAAGEHGIKGGRRHKAEKLSVQNRAEGLGKSSEQAARIVGDVSARMLKVQPPLKKQYPAYWTASLTEA